MPPLPVLIVGGGLLLAGAAYIVYKASHAADHAHQQEVEKLEGLADGGVP